MNTSFYILLHIKTPAGTETFGRFDIGNNHDNAYHLFKQLSGNTATVQDDLLLLELMETVNELPVNIKLMGCSLQQLAGNITIITKEVFRQKAIAT